VRPLIRHKAAVAGEQVKFDAARHQTLVVFQVAMPGHRALDFVVGFRGNSRLNAALPAVITGAMAATSFMTMSPGVCG
jgi:hypothetical protein